MLTKKTNKMHIKKESIQQTNVYTFKICINKYDYYIYIYVEYTLYVMIGPWLRSQAASTTWCGSSRWPPPAAWRSAPRAPRPLGPRRPSRRRPNTYHGSLWGPSKGTLFVEIQEFSPQSDSLFAEGSLQQPSFDFPILDPQPYVPLKHHPTKGYSPFKGYSKN